MLWLIAGSNSNNALLIVGQISQIIFDHIQNLFKRWKHYGSYPGIYRYDPDWTDNDGIEFISFKTCVTLF